MKQLLLVVLLIASLQSCIKTVDVTHDIHDTTYINLAGHNDTVSHFAIIHDTITRSSVANDTVQIVKHDTLYITTTRIDTVLRYFIDTAYITRTVHDTVIRVQEIVKVQHDTTQIWSYDTVYVNRNVTVHDTVSRVQYLHDTINNVSVVYLHDTIVRIDKVITHDTVLRYNSLYPVPATDSVVMKYQYDPHDTTLYPGKYGGYDSGWIHVFSVTFTSVVPSPDGTYQTFTAKPRMTPFYDKVIGYTYPSLLTITAPKMLCTIRINWSWQGGAVGVIIGYGPFEQMPTTVWKIWSYGKIAACGDPYDESMACSNTSFAIPLADVKEIFVSSNPGF
jgi:hypothetical protein